ncbi:hypothetical protein [Nocardia donostiensis]|uniref:Putative zinc-finger domain-containing protein n=1 Tax=Nocardia donostiensis TaxID=1538463 RepID=A0A1W0B518_9NOCA|nr:hypothetical protein [Nocardia donostiensis]ONM50671.1 hypothetical protein B0T46_01945 [Nocardia donostiensis]OQS17643.1 hypothetical protein B0T44_23850 [Nocardia donostiensis]
MSDDFSTSGRRQPRFRSTEHLASEAVAAYVDGELRMNPYLRAAQHLSVCPECAAEVEAQQQARIALRRAGQVSIPSGLHDSLTRIPLAEFPGGAANGNRSSDAGNPRNEAVFGFLSASSTSTFDSRRWSAWWRK